MLEKFSCHAFRVNAGGHEVMPPVPEDADDFGGQGLIQDFDCCLPVSLIAFGNRAILDVLTGALAQSFDISKKRFVSNSFRTWLISHGFHSSI